MTTASIVTQLAIALLGAGLLKFVTDLYGVRKAKRLEGPERNNIIAEGAEAAVASLKLALEDANASIERLRNDVTVVKEERDALADEVQALRIEVHLLQDELHGYVHRSAKTRQRRTDKP